MFIDEAKIAVQLQHANIAQIFDLGKVGDSYFIALEYVHGKDVRAIFDLTRAKAEPMSVAMACYIVMRSARGSTTRTTSATPWAATSSSCTATCRRRTS
jgi:serine/threonine protein kinase